MAQSGDIHKVGVLRMGSDPRNVPRILQPHILPGFSGIGRTINAVAVSHINPYAGLSHACINNVGVSGRNINCAHRSSLEKPIGDVFPVGPAIVGLPYAASASAEVKHCWIHRVASDCHDTTASWRANAPPLQSIQ